MTEPMASVLKHLLPTCPWRLWSSSRQAAAAEEKTGRGRARHRRHADG
ncbi:hypothetical protein LP419_30505 [Massilia sp. H-1]|nr:hypothetical protein LP419_30505 [Massilia sp. H-1]